uniref:Mif2/CENP-C cupin domain-containing protein n=1 Tax=Culex tarsalis TaxID=7177 RepID=A0A1Q3F6E8_CULTA
MEDFNPRSPIRLSDIDNLLQESIFESSDGAKLVEYLKKKRGGGRVRLQNIFQQVPVQRAQFNFNLDSSEPTPLPASPQPTTSNGDNDTEVVTNGGVQKVAASPVVVKSVSPRVPIVIVNDLNSSKKSTVKQIVLKSPGPMNTLSRQLLINQYQRTNAAKCELLKQLASSTPKPDTNGSLGRMSTFTTSISPITEGERSPLTPVDDVIPSSQPAAAVVAEDVPVHVMEIVIPPAASQEVLVPCSQPILAPCSQAVPTEGTPKKKVVVLKTVTDAADDVVIPETPSPVKVVPTESPKAPPNHIQPRRLSTTFKQMEDAEDANGHMTSDESEGEEEEVNSGSNSVLLKSILKDTSMAGGARSRHSMRVSFSKQLVQQREISPAPDIPEAEDYADSNSSDDSDLSDSDEAEENDFQVVDEVYTDDDGEEAAANREHYEELKSRICELNNSHNGRRSVSPLIDVVKETPVQWFETTTPTKRRDQQTAEEQQFPPPTTVKKDNKTNLQLVDIITDWDDEEDEEEADQEGATNPEVEPSQECVPEPRASTNSNNHDTNLDTMDISSSNLEDSVERLVELPPDPNALVEEEGVLPEEHIYPAAVDEQMPSAPQPPPITTEELVDVLSDKEPQPEQRSETPKPVEQPVPEQLPPPPKTPAEEARSPDRVITPPVQFTSSAKRRFIQQNEDDLISRLQNDLPLSQASCAEADTSSQSLKSFEKVSETLVEIAQSFRDQPPAPSAPPVDTTARRLVQPPKRGGKKSNVDPVTASYFEAIEKTFAKPKVPPTTQRKKTEQRRKLYDATLSEVTEDDDASPAVVAKPAVKARQDPKVRALKVVVVKLRVEDYQPRKVASRPEPVAQEAPPKAAPKSRRASKDTQPEGRNDSTKKSKGRPKKVQSIGEQEPLEQGRPVENGHVEDATRKKKRKLKPNLVGDARQQRESLPNGTPTEDGAEQDARKDEVVEKKKRSKPSQSEQRSSEVPPNGSLVKEDNIQKDQLPEKRKKKPKPNLAAEENLPNGISIASAEHEPLKEKVVEKQKTVNGESVPTEKDVIRVDKVVEKKKKGSKSSQHVQDQLEVLPTVNGESVPPEEQSIPKDKVVEKKKRSKPTQHKELAQEERPVEGLPTVNGELATTEEQDTRKDKSKKKKLKPNLAAVTEDTQLQQPEPVPAVVAQSSNEVVAKRKKLRPNFGTKSKQQHAEVAPPLVVDEVTDVGGKERPAVAEAQPVPTPSTVTASSVQPEIQLKQLKVKVTKLAVAPTTVSMGTASQSEALAAIEPSPAPTRKLFDDAEPQAKAARVSKKSRKKQQADEDSRHKRKEARKRAKLQSPDPIPKVRISAEKDGLYRITTPGREIDPAQDSFVERLNVTASENSANIRSSLEDCQEEFLGFEDDEDTIANQTVDLSRSNMELIIPLERTPIPKCVRVPSSAKKSRKPPRQPRVPAKKRQRSREPKQPKRISGSTSEPAPKATSPERPAVLDNRSLPLKKRKSRDSSQEYLPSAPEDDAVFAKPAPPNLNDSLLIPMLQRVPIADKYVVRSTPDRGAESTEYETDDTCATGDNVLIVRKDTSRLDQSRLLPVEAQERGPNVKKKVTNRRPSIPLPRFYGDNTFDITWKPRYKISRDGAASRKNKRRLDNDSGIEEEDGGGVVRRSKRTCRISKQILMTNPLIKSAYDRPNYRPMSVEQLLEAEKMAKKLKQEEKAKRQRQPGATTRVRKHSRSPRNRKRIQERAETQEGEQQAKRNRTDSAVELADVPSTSSSSSSSSSGAASCAEVAVQCEEDPTVQQERMQAQTWMMKLMAENSGREEVMPQATSSGDRMHFTLDHLTFQERNGIHYSFFIYSETENFGFLRFAPAAVKKWTKTADFLLKFLVLHGQLSFQINGKETVTKGGDFLMLPQNTRYRIQNSDEISLVFMIKFRAAPNELPSM